MNIIPFNLFLQNEIRKELKDFEDKQIDISFRIVKDEIIKFYVLDREKDTYDVRTYLMDEFVNLDKKTLVQVMLDDINDVPASSTAAED